ncbi:MAG: hypothetical protein AAB263_11565 [Planctomycetota bacterium]
MAKTEQLYAGFANADITPDQPRGMTLFGMGRSVPGAVGVLDHLFVRATYIGTHSQGVLMVVLDLVSPIVISPRHEDVIAELARVTGLPAQRIWILCTHCHSAPGENAPFGWGDTDHYQLRSFNRYIEMIIPRIIAVGIKAYKTRQAVEIGYASAPVAQVTASRRVKSSAGIVLTGWANGPTPPPGMRIVERGVHDPELGVIVFRNLRHRPIAMLLNYSSHIHLYPMLNFSSELAGAVVRKVEKRFPGLMAIYTNGAEGSVSLDKYRPPMSKNPADWDRQYVTGIDMYSNRVLRAVQSAWKKLSFASRVHMRCAETAVPLRVFDRVNGRIPTRSSPLAKPLTAITINDLALVGHAEEAFVDMALDLKARSPFPATFLLGFQGFRQRYFPSDHGTEEGGYESSIRYQGDAMSKTVTGAVKLLNKMRA